MHTAKNNLESDFNITWNNSRNRSYDRALHSEVKYGRGVTFASRQTWNDKQSLCLPKPLKLRVDLKRPSSVWCNAMTVANKSETELRSQSTLINN